MRLSRFTNAYFGATRPRNARLRPRGQVIPEVVIEAPGISPARKPRINLRPTGDGEACEDPRSRRIWRSQRRQCDFTGAVLGLAADARGGCKHREAAQSCTSPPCLGRG